PGIFQSLAAAAIGASCYPFFSHLWQRIIGSDPPDWAKATLPNALAAGVALGLIIFGSHGVALFRRTARAKGDRIAVYVARLVGDDESGTLRRSVIDTIINELGRDAMEVIPAAIMLQRQEGYSDEDSLAGANIKARKFLLRKRAQLLVWG